MIDLSIMSRDIHTKKISTTVQCGGHTRTGARCKRRTARTSFCYFHLNKEHHLQIKKSQISGGGLGLWTTIARPAKRMVAPYTGEVVHREKNDYGGDYVIQLNNKSPFRYVDARRTNTAPGRFANMARTKDHKRNNAKLSLDYKNPNQAKVVSLQKIPANREILTSYGNQFWKK